MDFPAEWITLAFAALMPALADPMAPVISINGFLDPEGSEKVTQTCRKVLGGTGFNWDNAYIVRVETEEILRALKR